MSNDPTRWERERDALFARKDHAMTRIRELLEQTEHADELEAFELIDARARLQERLEEVDDILLALSRSRLEQERDDRGPDEL